jgi:hypothetical protein
MVAAILRAAIGAYPETFPLQQIQQWARASGKTSAPVVIV